MKLVKEHLNEKFIEDSDPIYDLGIGIHFTSLGNSSKYNVTSFDDYRTAEHDVKLIIYFNDNKTNFLFRCIKKSMHVYTYDLLELKDTMLTSLFCELSGYPNDNDTLYMLNKFILEYESNHLREAFTDNSDPIYDMGIGTKSIIIKNLQRLLDINREESGVIDL